MSSPAAGADANQPAPEAAEPHGVLQRLVEPPVLFTMIGVLVLTVIWLTAFNLVATERAAAERAAASLTADVADTYEAQVVRALREIDHTLKLVRYALDIHPAEAALEDLDGRGLLPPALLFSVAIADADGRLIVASDDPVAEHVPFQDLLPQTEADGELVIGAPRRDPESDEWTLDFARGVEPAGDGVARIVTVSVHAGYFVSGYDPSVMGASGVLGLLGTDGMFRVRRTGDALFAAKQVDYPATLSLAGEDDQPAAVVRSPWDEIPRYLIIRELFEFPLATVVGLSEAEQLAHAAAVGRVYLLRAGAASLLLVAVVAMLGVLSWRLQQARARAMEERVAHAKRVEYLAFHDNLTDLPNRAYFSRLLVQGMERSKRYGQGLALLFLDLDRFKAINDSLGHDAGDELLQEIGQRLTAAVRASDIVARLGGDEFVVLLPEIASRQQVVPVAEKILAATARAFRLAGQDFRITVSIGITVYPEDGADEQTLMKNADVAMYHAKEQGKNNYQFYSQALHTDSLERLALEASLRNALEREEFRIHYQPRRSLTTGTINGMEALLYWDHPELGLVPPAKFLSLAEDSGLILPIGRWLIRAACQRNVQWQDEGFPPLSIAVSLTARQFSDGGLLEDITQTLRETGMDPKLLEVEVTESVILRDLDLTVRTLNALRDMGVSVAIDDFGNGYSSLSTLKQVPFDTIKLGSSCLPEIGDGKADDALARSLIAVGRNLSLSVVLEGVDASEENFETLQRHLRDQFQGIYGREPLPEDQFETLLRAHFA